jgi:hypothetical protein
VNDDQNGHPASPDGVDDVWQEPGGISMRVLLPIVAVLAVAAAVYVGYTLTQSLGSGSSFSDRVANYPPDSVTYLSNGRTYLVRQNDGTFLALSEVEASATDRIAGCLIRYLPGKQGAFRDDCHGVMFNLEGVAVQGAAPPMQRHPVTVHGGKLTVQLKVCLQGGSSDQIEPCRE